MGGKKETQVRYSYQKYIYKRYAKILLSYNYDDKQSFGVQSGVFNIFKPRCPQLHQKQPVYKLATPGSAMRCELVDLLFLKYVSEYKHYDQLEGETIHLSDTNQNNPLYSEDPLHC